MLRSVITIVYQVKQIVYFSIPYLMNTRGTPGVRWLISIFFLGQTYLPTNFFRYSFGFASAKALFLPYIFYGGQVADSAKIALTVT